MKLSFSIASLISCLLTILGCFQNLMLGYSKNNARLALLLILFLVEALTAELFIGMINLFWDQGLSPDILIIIFLIIIIF